MSKNNIRLPVSYKITIGIILVILLQGSISYWISYIQLKENAFSEKINNIQADIVILQETLQFLSSIKNYAQLQKTVASLGVYVDVKEAFLLDENNIVKASTRIGYIGKHTGTLFSIEEETNFKNHLFTLRTKLKNIIWESSDGTSIYAISPVILGRSSEQLLRSDRIGTLYIHTDMSLTNNKAIQSLKNNMLPDFIVLVLAGLILVLFFNSGIIRRIKLVNSAASKYFNSNYKARISVTGNDEVTDLSKAFNSMANKVEEQLIEITSREKILKLH